MRRAATYHAARTMTTNQPPRGRTAALFVFATAIAATPVVDAIAEGRPIRSIHAEALRRGTFFDGSWMRAAERAIRGRSPVVVEAASAYGAALYAACGVARTYVVAGRDGRLHSSAWWDLGPADPEASGACAAAVLRRTEASGRRSTVALVPEARATYPTSPPASVRDVGDLRPLYARTLAAMRARGVRAADLLTELDRLAAAGVDAHFLTESHWTPEGAMAAAEAAVASSGERVPPEGRRTRIVRAEPVVENGDLLTGRQDRGPLSPQPLAAAILSAFGASAVRRGAFLVDGDGLHVPPPDGTTAADTLVVGSSYSSPLAGGSFPGLLSHALDRPVRARYTPSTAFVRLTEAFAEEARAGLRSDRFFWETPLTALLRDGPSPPGFGDFFALVAPARTTPLMDGDRPTPLVTIEGPGLRGRMVEPGRLFHDGDGAVAFRRGPGRSGVVVGGRLDYAPVTLPGGLKAEATLPVVDVRPVMGGGILTATPFDGEDDVALVTDLDLAAGPLAKIGPLDAAGLVQIAEFADGGAPIAPFSELELVLSAAPRAGDPTPLHLRVELFGAPGSTPIVRDVAGAAVSARILVNPAALGEKLTRVRVTAEGPPQRKLLRTAALRPLAGP